MRGPGKSEAWRGTGGRGGVPAQGRWTPSIRAVGARTGGRGIQGRGFLPGPFFFLREVGTGSGLVLRGLLEPPRSLNTPGLGPSPGRRPLPPSAQALRAKGSHPGPVGAHAEMPAAGIT